MTSVCCFGAWDPDYPRNRVVRAGLAAAGFDVLEARVRAHRAWRRWPALAKAWARVAPRTDVVLVPEFRHKDVPLARALRGRRPLVFDPLISRWDTLVDDWGLHAAGSGQARWNRAIDRWSLASPWSLAFSHAGARAQSIADRTAEGPALTEGAIAQATVGSCPDGALLVVGNSTPVLPYPNPFYPAYMDVRFELEDPFPAYLSEQGLSSPSRRLRGLLLAAEPKLMGIAPTNRL